VLEPVRHHTHHIAEGIAGWINHSEQDGTAQAINALTYMQKEWIRTIANKSLGSSRSRLDEPG
jgi:hypothetical protein